MATTVNLTLDITLDGVRTTVARTNVPKAAFHLAERALHALRGEALDWSLAELISADGKPPFTGPATGNLVISYTADSSDGANWSDSITQNGIPADAAGYLASKVQAIFTSLGAA